MTKRDAASSSRSGAAGRGRAPQPELDFSGATVADARDPQDTHEEEAPLTVGELVALIAETLEGPFSQVLVMGELTSFKRAASGHCYFTLSDGGASIDAVMWRTDAGRLTFQPAGGDEVVCRGRIGVYERQGRMQLYASALKPVGAGAAQKALEALKKKLAAEGLFDPERKRALPYLPATIGVVTSRAGAALHDILTTLHRRFSACRVVVSPAVVQGEEAPRELVAALAALERFGACDVVIVGRGGGAAEDLAAFNDEAVVRAVASFPVPVVSAVGHEVDFTLCDLAADLRAATPTAAAESVVPVHAELAEELATLEARLGGAVHRHLDYLRHRVGIVAGGLRDPATLVATHRQRVDELFIRLERALVGRHRRASDAAASLHHRLQGFGREYAGALGRRVGELEARMIAGMGRRRLTAETGFAALRAKLDAMSPLAVLDRGYSLASRGDGKLVRSFDEISAGDELRIRFAVGAARAKVVATEGES